MDACDIVMLFELAGALVVHDKTTLVIGPAGKRKVDFLNQTYGQRLFVNDFIFQKFVDIYL